MEYDHNWKAEPSGCADNRWWLTFWRTSPNMERFKVPEFERNISSWDFLGEKLPEKIVSYNPFK